MKRLSLLFTMMFMVCAWSFAQRTVTGLIQDYEGEPLIGANVLVKGTSIGTVTDFDGKFSITLPDGSNILVISYTGFASEEIDVTSVSDVEVTMSPDVIGLEDVVVVGYSPTRRKDITGSVSEVGSEDIQAEAGVGLQTALRGRAAGVQVFQSSGTPGAAMNVRVRGSTSINASNSPLYIIDGVPLIQGSFSQVGVGGQDINALADLNPNDIESIQVLKDAATAAIYGNRAANGVVLITTKKGKAGRTNIDLDASYGVQEVANLVELANSEQYREMLTELYGAPILAGGLTDPDGNFYDTDWYDEIFRTSNIQNYSLSASGGNEKTRFFTNLSFNDNEGIVKNSQFKRYSGRLNLDHIATDKFSLGMNLGYNHSQNRRVRNDNNIFGAISVATLWPASVPIYNEQSASNPEGDGTYASAFGWDNPVATVSIYDNLVTTNRLTGNAYGKYELFEGLSFKLNVGIDALDLLEDVYEPSALQSSNNGTARVAQTRAMNWLSEATLTYQKRFGNNSLTAVAGVGLQEYQRRRDYSEVNDFPTDDFKALDAGATPTTITGDFAGDRLLSAFANVNYSFKDKYILTGTFRADGSSRFVNDKWGYFPGLSAAWRISGEDFMQGGFFDDLKLRVGWGITGNNNIGFFEARQLYGGGANYLDAPGIVATQLGNPDLTWETTAQINVGLDFAILESRLSGSVDFYQKNTTDLLLNRPIPTTSGFTTVPTNVGEVQNTGVEFALNAIPVSTPNFSWDINFNIAYNKNEIIELFNGQPIDQGFATRLAEGHPIGAFFGYITDGIFQNEQEVEAHAFQNNAAPGDIRFRDISGGAGPDGVLGTSDDLPPDGVINDADRTFIGQALPDWTGGLTNIFRLGGLELNTFFQFSIGNDIYNNNLEFSEGMHSIFNVTKRAWEGRWQQEGDDEDFPRAALGDPNNNRRNSTRMVEDGSFLRLKTATLSYSLPSSLFGNSGFRKLKVYVTGTNLLTFTNYSWFDPEVSTFGADNTALGTDFLTFPQARSFVFGINLGF